jgi:plasmid stability protein
MGTGVRSIIIRRLDESIKTRLQARAARHGRSMEAEAREILKSALARRPGSSKNLAERIHARFVALGGFELPHIPREPMREPPTFDE